MNGVGAGRCDVATLLVQYSDPPRFRRVQFPAGTGLQSGRVYLVTLTDPSIHLQWVRDRFMIAIFVFQSSAENRELFILFYFH